MIPSGAPSSSTSDTSTDVYSTTSGWAVHNGIRYDDYVVARGGRAWVPFLRVWLADRTVAPENGPGSRRLAELTLRNENARLSRVVEIQEQISGARQQLVGGREVALLERSHPGHGARPVPRKQ